MLEGLAGKFVSKGAEEQNKPNVSNVSNVSNENKQAIKKWKQANI